MDFPLFPTLLFLGSPFPFFFSTRTLYHPGDFRTFRREKNGGEMFRSGKGELYCATEKKSWKLFSLLQKIRTIFHVKILLFPPCRIFPCSAYGKFRSHVCVSYKWGEGEREKIAAGIQNTHLQQVGGKESGSPSSSLLINIDPAQNSTFFPQKTHLLVLIGD